MSPDMTKRLESEFRSRYPRLNEDEIRTYMAGAQAAEDLILDRLADETGRTRDYYEMCLNPDYNESCGAI